MTLNWHTHKKLYIVDFMIDIFSISISAIALLISGVTLWLTLLRRAKLRMTKTIDSVLWV